MKSIVGKTFFSSSLCGSCFVDFQMVSFGLENFFRHECSENFEVKALEIKITFSRKANEPGNLNKNTSIELVKNNYCRKA